MKPVFSAATKISTDPPELDRPLPDDVKVLAPPYSIPYIYSEKNGKLPDLSISEWKPSKEELEALNAGGSVFVVNFTKDHPNISVIALNEKLPLL